MVSSKEIVQMKDKQQQQRPREKNKKQKISWWSEQSALTAIRFDAEPIRGWRFIDRIIIKKSQAPYPTSITIY